MFDSRIGIGGQFFRTSRFFQRIQQIFTEIWLYRLINVVVDKSRLKSFVVRERVLALAESYGLPKKFFVQRIFFIEAGKDVAGELRIYTAVSANFCPECQRNQRVDKIYERRLVEVFTFMTVKQIHQNNPRISGVKQINQLINLFVERGKIFKLSIVVEDTAAEKFCVTI